MEIKTITELAQILADTQKSFEAITLTENKVLLKKINALIELIHGERSRNKMGYYHSNIEVEVIQCKHKLQITILSQMIHCQEYEKASIEECWEDFDLAHKLDFGSFGGNPKTNWSNKGLARKAMDHVFETLFIKLDAVLSEGVSKEKIGYMKKISGLSARYTPGTLHYNKGKELLDKFDKAGEFQYQWV